jgi:hypothetical protein
MSPRPLIALLLTALFLPNLSAKDPPLPPKELPGTKLGQLHTKWLGPHVVTTGLQFGDNWQTEVRWFSPQGKILRTVSGTTVGAQPGFVYDYDDDAKTIYGVNRPWVMSFPKTLTTNSYHTSTPDSRTYVVEHHPREGLIALDIFIDGKKASMIGPYPQYEANGVHLSNDGSTAMLTWKDDKKTNPQVVVAGPDGKLCFQVDCPQPMRLSYDTSITPGGDGVLLQPNRGGDDNHLFLFFTKTGQTASIRLKYNPYPVLWLPGTHKALFCTNIGDNYKYSLVDCDTGATLWSKDDPLSKRTGSYAPQWVAMKHLLLQAGREAAMIDGREYHYRSLAALDSTTGNVVARWKSDYLSASDTTDRLLQLDRRVFLMSDSQFSEIHLDDVLQKKNGWK